MENVDTKDTLKNLEAQSINDGVGEIYHRIYECRFAISEESFEKLVEKFFCDINAFCPQVIATFKPSCAQGERLKPGDNIDIRISGPWNGPVRVIQADKTSLTLMTLEGHLEAGKISFSFTHEDGRVLFRIESFARSKDKIVDFFYDKFPISRFMQREMWVTFCENVANEAQKIDAGDPELEFPIARVDVLTQHKPPGETQWQIL